MALAILDGNQTAVTLATTVSGSQHFPNHIITSGTVTANVGGVSNILLGPPIAVAYSDEPFGDGRRLAVAIVDSNGSEYGSTGTALKVSGSVTLGAGTEQIGSVTASLAISSTAITSGSFSSLTSATLVPRNTARKMATVYNLGAGQLFVNAGATATTLGGGFMVALSSGDFYECDYTTTTLSALFATAGTASWVSH
jgi:hypothetical protein